jgi:O-antigen ligase
MINILKSRQPNELRTSQFWLSLLLGALLAVTVAYLVIQQEWVYLIALLVTVPAIILLYTYPFAAVLIWLLLFPFFLREVLPGARMIYWLLHRALIPGAVLALLVLSAAGIRKIKDFRMGLVDWVMIGYLVYSLANIILLGDRFEPLLIRYYDRIFVPFCMYWLVRLLNPDEKDLKRLLPVAFFLILSQAVIGILGWTAPQLLPEKWLSRLGERTVGTFSNPGVFTTTLVFCALFLLHAAHNTKSALLRWFAIVSVGLVFFQVFFSFSRGSWLGGAAFLVGLLFIYPKTIARLILAGVLIAGFMALDTPLRTFFGFAEERLVTETTVEGRIVGGASTMRMIIERPLFGWGYNQHEKYDEQFRDRVLNVARNREHSSHNTYLLITAEMGVAGLVLYLLPTLIWLVRSVRTSKYLPWSGYPGRAILVMLWLLLADHFIVGNFTDLIQSTLFNTSIWWLALGLIANINDAARAKVTPESSSMLGPMAQSRGNE